MRTERIYFRERTNEVIVDLFSLSTKEQLLFLGIGKVEHLKAELNNIEKNLNNKNTTRKK